MAQRLVMVVDAASCIDCKGCMAACKTANQVPEGQWRNWIKAPADPVAARQKGRVVFQPGGCMQCSEPSCVSACPTGATYQNPGDGVVYIDRALCIGCGQCLPACPYGARYRHPELRVADKCDFCQERRAAGLSPACVDTCPTKARTFGDLNDPQSQVAALLAGQATTKVVNAQSDTKPNMYYTGDPGPTDWPRPAQMPAAFDAWRLAVGPAVKALVGLTGLGVVAMLAKQIFMQDEPPAHHGPEDKGGDHE